MSQSADPDDALLQLLTPRILQGREDETLEFKREIDPWSKPGQARLAKDIAAMANTGRPGHIVVGVEDVGHRTGQGAGSCFVGVSAALADRAGADQAIQQAVSNYLDPPVRVRYTVVIEPETSRPIGLLLVHRSYRRPHQISRQGEGVDSGDTWIRGDSHLRKASSEELREMFGERQEGSQVIVLNFSHPLTDEARRELSQATGLRVDYVIDVPVQMDDEVRFASQARGLAEAVGLSSHDWQKAPVIVVLPGLAPAAAALLAELHGRMGHFPTVLRLRPERSGDVTTYAFGELMNLERARADARSRR